MSKATDLPSRYRQAFRKKVHRLIAWGYQDAKAKCGPKEEEESITGYISDAVELRLDDPGIPSDYNSIGIHEEKPHGGDGRKGKGRYRIDIQFKDSSSRPRARFSIEAKRLKTGGFPIGAYTGNEGMECFLNGSYARNEPEVAMLAYVQNKEFAYWHRQLHSKFDNDAGLKRTIKRELKAVEVILELPHELLSEHNRNGASVVMIYHIFLDCRVA